ncbi:hypothetical protein [Desulfovibrio cuneatus]|uniref:hypothetical protein n=1 Tax=Desulfovibrio cuneatus TaxID=159728 RepID=UPI000404A52B|nr:hypothetical protein [Desulfovibrio cuneatus]
MCGHGTTPQAPDPAQNNAIATAPQPLGMDPISRLYDNVTGLEALAATMQEALPGLAFILGLITADVKKCVCCLDDAGVLPPEACS